ncbi:type III ribulose-bisphosphate carboxylase [Candidatus Woesearchaeota archaeon]|nr:type III ribulose-bisphosphate carboxylase [Candidatus Woesearchaeota archaeon]
MSEKIEWYKEFVNKNYKPKNNDVKVLFYYEAAKGMKVEDALGRIASESSSGTWTTLTNLPKLLPKTKAYAYNYSKNYTKLAYPRILFENGSVPCMMSGIGGNIFGMKAITNLRLIDAELPLDYVKGFKGPTYGKEVIKKIFKRKSGPITSVVPKPKVGYTAKEHAEVVAKAVWRGGMDCVKDDENLTSQKFNKFEERVKHMARVRDQVMKETGEVKDAFINTTAPTLKELERRVKLIHDYGFNYFMIDVVVSGFTAVGTASELAHDYKMAIHGHRAMHAMFARNPKHGMTMLFLAKLMRLIGVDQLHTGTVVGKLEGSKEEIMAMKDMLTKKEVGEITNLRMPQKWGKIKPVLPVSSGGLHPGILPEVFDIYGTTDIGIQCGGGSQGHPDGIEAGARAIMQSIEAYKQKISLKEYAETHNELKVALQKWGYLKPM